MRVKGKVKWFNDKKGYGFITCAGVGDVFIHYSHINLSEYKTLETDDNVELELIETEKGFHAEEVEIINEVKT